MKPLSWFKPVFLLCTLSITGVAAADDMVLMQSPVKVTATARPLEEGGLTAQIAVHHGPVAQVVGTTLNGVPPDQVENALRHQLKWNAPYLLVHSTCNINSVRRCEGDVVFKVSGNKVQRLGDFVQADTPVLNKGHFYDSYDKLGEQVDFTIVMNDVNDELQVDADATWAHNIDSQTNRASYIANIVPSHEWTDADWEHYLGAVINNAALARYCDHTDSLDQLLAQVNPRLSLERRRQLADTLSKVVPLEKPKMWRKAY